MSLTGSSPGGNAASSAAGGIAAFQNSFELSPIILVQGLAANVTGGKIAVQSLLQPNNWPQGLLSPSAGVDPDDFFARFVVMAGDTLIENQIAHWPLANQQVAANAVIEQPLRLALRMICPGREESGVTYAGKQAVMQALQSSLIQHINAGGWFDVATPAFLYQGCLLTALRDVTDSSGGGQVQLAYVWEFEQPLITVAAAQGAMNIYMQKITNQTVNTGGPLGSNPANASVGNPNTGLAPATQPAASSLSGASVQAATQSTGAAPPLNAVAPIPPGS